MLVEEKESPLHFVAPVIGGADLEEVDNYNWITTPHDIFGTAFPIGPNLFLTAGHVLKAAAERAFVGLGVAIGENLRALKTTSYEIIESHDIGLIAIPWGRSKGFVWTISECGMLESVQSIGYPYAVDRTNMSIVLRGFTGHIVSARYLHHLSAVPKVYELSYPCPRGLSGAPVWTASRNVAGIIIGNSISEMDVYSEKEIDTQGRAVTVYRRVEALHLGIALQTSAVIGAHSKLLGKTIGEYLRSYMTLDG
jgi:V8-like Glu-specific endopeptidase